MMKQPARNIHADLPVSAGGKEAALASAVADC